MKIRAATARDAEGIRNVHLNAFPTAGEADLVERLAHDGDVAISIVAGDEAIAGHILLSWMRADADGRGLRALGLGPLAVIPERQGEGIGSALIQAAVAKARANGAEIIFVLGEPEYYGRFGFSVAAAAPFESPYAGPHFQALALGDLQPLTSGIAEYAPAFASLG